MRENNKMLSYHREVVLQGVL